MVNGLINKNIIQILIGDTPVNFQMDHRCDYCYKMPYLSGPDICRLGASFGLKIPYLDGSAKPRWEYMKDLLNLIFDKGFVDNLLSYLFNGSRFDHIFSSSIDEPNIDDIRSSFIDTVVEKVNCELSLFQEKIEYDGSKYHLRDANGQIINAESLRVTTSYIRALPDRIANNILNKEFDSVVSKSRLMIEETCIFILEQKCLPHSEKGDVGKLYAECRASLNMMPSNQWEKFVQELVGGLNKIVSAIGCMRDKNSTSHGVGSKRISIKEREAKLIANSSMTLCEYLLDIFESQK
jgi:hypothetical protein